MPQWCLELFRVAPACLSLITVHAWRSLYLANGQWVFQGYVTPRPFSVRSVSVSRDQVRGLIHSEVSSKPKDHRDEGEWYRYRTTCCSFSMLCGSHSASVCSSLFLCVGWNKEGTVWGCPRNVKLNQVSCRKAFRGEKNIYWNKKKKNMSASGNNS